MLSTQAPPPHSPDRLGEASLWLGTLLTLLPQLVRATSNSTTFPGWDLDPLLYSLSSPAITPSGSLLIDAVTLLGASLLLFRAARLGTPLNLSLILLTLFGASAVVFHGWFDSARPFSLGQQRTGASWLSAIFSALALWHAAQDLRVRRIFVATLLGLVSLLSICGIQQVFFTHALTLADFNANPNRFLAAHGWSPDSSMAKAFIRRLSQPEAVGWFGLANVYASFAAAATAAGLALLLRSTGILPVSWSPSPSPSSSSSKSNSSSLPPSPFLPTLLLSLFTLLSATALFLAHSKGGYLAFIAVLHSIAFLFFFASRPPSPNSRRLATLLGIAAILGPIALVLLRGLIGERAGLHELSLLFRSFYTHASARIFLDNPVVGVGPDGYQSAFLLAKPPLCPEEVMSPHCIVQDWLADLGILGAAWLCILFRFAIQATTNAISTPIRAISTPISATATSLSAITTPSLKFEISNLKLPPPPPPSRPDLRLLLLLPALATILAAYIESPFITIDLALVRVLGLAAWCATGFAIARLISDSPASRIALAAAALALIAHAQIDVTASFVPSAPLWLMLISLAAAPYTVPPRTALGPRCSPSHALQALAILPPLLLSSLLLYTSLSHVLPWERRLTNAAATVRPLAEFSERLAALSHIEHAAQPADSLDRIVRDLALAVGHPVHPNEVSFNTAMRELESQLLPKAAATLEIAHAILPDDWRPLREASRLHLQLAESARRVPHDTSPTPLIPSDELARLSIAPGHAHFVRAESILQLGPTAASRPHLPAEWHWLATILERRADLFSESDSLARATDARHHVAALDPYNLDNALRIFRDYQKLHDQPNAQRSAARTLELHNFTRLDRETRGLSPQNLADVQSAAQAP